MIAEAVLTSSDNETEVEKGIWEELDFLRVIRMLRLLRLFSTLSRARQNREMKGKGDKGASSKLNITGIPQTPHSSQFMLEAPEPENTNPMPHRIVQNLQSLRSMTVRGTASSARSARAHQELEMRPCS